MARLTQPRPQTPGLVPHLSPPWSPGNEQATHPSLACNVAAGRGPAALALRALALSAVVDNRGTSPLQALIAGLAASAPPIKLVGRGVCAVLTILCDISICYSYGPVRVLRSPTLHLEQAGSTLER